MYTKEQLENMAIDLLKQLSDYETSRYQLNLTYSRIDMVPSLLIENEEYHLDIYERGVLIHRESTQDVKRVLYWIIYQSIEQDVNQEIWKKYFDHQNNQLIYNDSIRNEQESLTVQKYQQLGNPYLDWYLNKTSFL